MEGLTGALNRQAITVYEGLQDVDKPWAKRICLQLVRVGRGDKDTRQRQPKAMLLSMGGVAQRQVIADVIADLVKGRLLVSDGGGVAETAYVDVAHEALLSGWEQFAAWRLEDRDLLRLEQRLKDAYEDWQAKEDSQERDKYLLTGGLLAEVTEQHVALGERLRGNRPALMKYLNDSSRKAEKDVEVLKKALAKASLQEESRKVLDKFESTSSLSVEATLSVIEIAGRSKHTLNELIPPVQNALHTALSRNRERLRIENQMSLVDSLAFNPSCDIFAAGNEDGTLRLWDMHGNPASQPSPSRHCGSIWSLAFSPKGDRIVSGGSDGMLYLWDSQGSPIICSFEGHTSEIMDVAFNHRGNLIVSGDREGILRLWNRDGKMIGDPFFVENSGSVLSLSFNKKGDHIVSCHDSGEVFLWNLAGEIVGKPSFFEATGFSVVAISASQNAFVCGDEDGALKLQNIDGNPMTDYFWCQSPVVSIVGFSPDGERIVSGSSNGLLQIWDLKGNSIGRPLAGHTDEILSLSFNASGDKIISSSKDGTTRLWDLTGTLMNKPFAVHHNYGVILSADFSPDGKRIVASGGSGMISTPGVCVWDLQGVPISSAFAENAGFSAISPKNNHIVCSKGSSLQVWDLEGNCMSPSFDGHKHTVSSVAFSPNGEQIVSGSYDGTVRLWELDGSPIGKPFIGHTRAIWSVAFSPKGDCIASASADRTLRLWDLDGNLLAKPFVGHTDVISTVVFSPAGEIASGSFDQTIRLWSVDGQPILEPMIGHVGEVNSLAFNPSGTLIASGGSDNTVRLWDVKGNSVGEPFLGHTASVNAVAFSPKGDLIVSGDSNQSIRVWPAGSGNDWILHCCNTLMHHSTFTSPSDGSAGVTAHNACSVCEQLWTKQLFSEFLVAQGSALARRGEIDTAIEKFNHAKELNAELTLDAVARANELAEWG